MSWGEWEHAAWPSSTRGRCTACMHSGNWTCKKCKHKKPRTEFAMWMEANPASNQDATTRCDSCMLLLQERLRQEEAMRKSNMAQVVKKKDYGQDKKLCSGCNTKYMREGNFTEHMWTKRGDKDRTCYRCTEVGKQNRIAAATASRSDEKKYTYICPKCTGRIPSNTSDGCVGRGHKKPDNKTVCGFQFAVRGGVSKN